MNCNFSVTFIKSLNQRSIKPCLSWFHVSVGLYRNKSQKRSKCGKNISDTGSCALFLPNFDVIGDLLLNRPMATWNLLVKLMVSLIVYHSTLIFRGECTIHYGSKWIKICSNLWSSQIGINYNFAFSYQRSPGERQQRITNYGIEVRDL